MDRFARAAAASERVVSMQQQRIGDLPLERQQYQISQQIKAQR